MEKHRTLILGLTVALCWFSLYAYLPILPAYARQLGASYEMVGMIVGAYGFTQMALRLPLGVMSDKLNARKVFVVIGLALCVVSSAGMWLVPSVGSLLIFRSLAGVAATTYVVQTILFASYYAEANSAQAMGNVQASATAGQMVATLIAGYLALRFGEEYTFLLAAAGGLVGFLLSLAIAEKARVARAPVKLMDMLAVVKERSLLVASGLEMVLQMVTYSTAYGFVTLVAKNIGANNFELGLLPTLFMLPGTFASAVSGTFFAAKFGMRLSTVMGLVLLAGPVFLIPLVSDLYALYATQVVAGFGRGLAFPLLMESSLRGVAREKRATAMGYFQSIYGLGMFVGPLIVGVLGDRWGLDWGFWAIGLIGLAGAAGAAFLLPWAERTEAAAINSCRACR